MRLQTCTNRQDSRKLSIETGMGRGNYTSRTGGQQEVAEEKRVAAHQTNSGGGRWFCCVLQRDEAVWEIPVTMLTNQLSVGQTITHQYDTDSLA